MSHSINAYLWSGIEGELSTGTVAHLDYNASDRDISFVFYRLLGAEQYDNGMSGSGESALFNRTSFERALELIAQYDCAQELSDEVDFLTKCLAFDKVYIRFS